MLAKMSASAASAADATKRAAQQTKLTGEITLLKQKIGTAKNHFGPLVFDAMAAGGVNSPQVSEHTDVRERGTLVRQCALHSVCTRGMRTLNFS